MRTPTQPLAPRGGPGSPDPGPAEDLVGLWNRLVEARDTVTRQRHLPPGSSASLARGELLRALEAYVAGLASHGRPIPYALRDDLRLQRLTCSADRYLRYE